MDKYYVYRHIRLDNNTPFYVGKGKCKRAYSIHQRNRYWKHIISQCDYEVEIIMEDLTEEQAFEKEIEFIKLYKDLGYCEANLTNGGEGTSGLEPWNKGIIGHYCMGEKNGRFGKPVSIETRDKIGASNKNRPCKVKDKLRAAMLGLRRSEQNKHNVAIAKGSKPFKVYKDANYVGSWTILRKCARELNLDHKSIKKCLMGYRKLHKGYAFQYE